MNRTFRRRYFAPKTTSVGWQESFLRGKNISIRLFAVIFRKLKDCSDTVCCGEQCRTVTCEGRLANRLAVMDDEWFATRVRLMTLEEALAPVTAIVLTVGTANLAVSAPRLLEDARFSRSAPKGMRCGRQYCLRLFSWSQSGFSPVPQPSITYSGSTVLTIEPLQKMSDPFKRPIHFNRWCGECCSIFRANVPGQKGFVLAGLKPTPTWIENSRP